MEPQQPADTPEVAGSTSRSCTTITPQRRRQRRPLSPSVLVLALIALLIGWEDGIVGARAFLLPPATPPAGPRVPVCPTGTAEMRGGRVVTLLGRGGGGGGGNDYSRKEEKSKRQLRVARVLQSTVADVIRKCVCVVCFLPLPPAVIMDGWIQRGWLPSKNRSID